MMVIKNTAIFFTDDIEVFLATGFELAHKGCQYQDEILLLFE